MRRVAHEGFGVDSIGAVLIRTRLSRKSLSKGRRGCRREAPKRIERSACLVVSSPICVVEGALWRMAINVYVWCVPGRALRGSDSAARAFHGSFRISNTRSCTSRELLMDIIYYCTPRLFCVSKLHTFYVGTIKGFSSNGRRHGKKASPGTESASDQSHGKRTQPLSGGTCIGDSFSCM